MNRRRWCHVPLMIALAGCATPWETLTESDPPIALTSAEAIEVRFDRTGLDANQGSGSEMNALLAVIEDETIVALNAADDDITVSRGAHHPSDPQVVAVIAWELVEPGRTGLEPVESQITARIAWHVGGRMTDALRITERMRPSIFALEPAARLRRCAQRLGRHLGAWLETYRP